MLFRAACSLLFSSALALAVDLKNASIVTAPILTPQEKQAVTMLQDEIAKRTRITLPIVSRIEKGSAIFVSEHPILPGVMNAPAGAEGFRVQTIGDTVVVAGNDSRGTLFGIGWLLRHLHMDRDTLDAPDDLKI